VIGWDPVLDLALVKTEIEPPPFVSLGTSRDLSVGNRIYAIGSPAGLEQTITSGNRLRAKAQAPIARRCPSNRRAD
jgi:S1-C subfamily serine protease